MWKVLIDSVKKFLYLLLKKEFIINVRTLDVQGFFYRNFLQYRVSVRQYELRIKERTTLSSSLLNYPFKPGYQLHRRRENDREEDIIFNYFSRVNAGRFWKINRDSRSIARRLHFNKRFKYLHYLTFLSSCRLEVSILQLYIRCRSKMNKI